MSTPENNVIPMSLVAKQARGNGKGPRAVVPPPAPMPTIIGSTWKPLDLAMLTEPPPLRRWLLRHPTHDGNPCGPGMGDGLLPLGKAGLLVADGGIGKTMALVALAVSTITGRPWFGHFEIAHEARRGRVLLALAEEDLEEVHRRLYDVAQAYRLDTSECARVAERLVVLPLAGKSISLLVYGLDGRTLLDSAELVALRERLVSDAGPDGWSLVVLDPLARWGADDTEKDNAVATRTLQACETLVEVPGGPTVLLAHHASQVAVKTGSINARGVTGIRNGARWEATLRGDGADVYFKQTKSNYSKPMTDELRLVRTQHGVLRVPTDNEDREYEARAEERANAKDAAKVERRAARVTALEGAIVTALKCAPAPVTSRKDLVALVPGAQAEKDNAAAHLLMSGRVVRQPPIEKGGKPTYLVAEVDAC